MADLTFNYALAMPASYPTVTAMAVKSQKHYTLDPAHWARLTPARWRLSRPPASGV